MITNRIISFFHIQLIIYYSYFYNLLFTFIREMNIRTDISIKDI